MVLHDAGESIIAFDVYKVRLGATVFCWVRATAWAHFDRLKVLTPLNPSIVQDGVSRHCTCKSVIGISTHNTFVTANCSVALVSFGNCNVAWKKLTKVTKVWQNPRQNAHDG